MICRDELSLELGLIIPNRYVLICKLNLIKNCYLKTTVTFETVFAHVVLLPPKNVRSHLITCHQIVAIKKLGSTDKNRGKNRNRDIKT